jgi:hypothetical protein
MSPKLYQFCNSVVAITGFLLVAGTVGGLDEATDSQLVPLFIMGVCGLALFYAGINQLTQER